VLPGAYNSSGQFVAATSVPGNPFNTAGIQPGDYMKVTDPATGQSVFTIYGDVGPSGQVGENSMAATSALGMNSSPINGGFNAVTDTQGLQYTIYPGSGLRDANGQPTKQSFQDIQRNGAWAEVTAEMKASGYQIKTGSINVFASPAFKPVAFANAMCLHVGDCPQKEGSDSVSVQGFPASRIGDACSCGARIVSGYDPVVVGGSPTSAPATAGSGDDSPTLFGGMTQQQLTQGLNPPKAPAGWK
jgi:uncharacterized Zn-binding protein involved in type VI secretion